MLVSLIVCRDAYVINDVRRFMELWVVWLPFFVHVKLNPLPTSCRFRATKRFSRNLRKTM